MKMENLVGLSIPILYLLFLGIESRRPGRQFEYVSQWRRIGALFFVTVLAVGSAAPLLLPLTWFRQHALIDLSQLGLLALPFGLLLSTFTTYWLHRAEHRYDWMWRAFHQLHHSALRVDTSGALFTHPLGVLVKVSMTSTVNMYVLGLSPLAAYSVGLITTILSLFQHWNVRTPHWLGYIVPRPESHVLHHERDVHARNYGDLPIWDMLFGTYVNPRVSPNVKVGFRAGVQPRVKDMLLMRDVNQSDR